MIRILLLFDYYHYNKHKHIKNNKNEYKTVTHASNIIKHLPKAISTQGSPRRMLSDRQYGRRKYDK